MTSHGAALAFSLLLVAACDNPNPGTQLGTFAVASALSTNSCGGAVAPSSPGSFDVTLSNDQGVIYWFPNNGAPSATGSLSASGAVTIHETVADAADTSDASTACVLERTDTLSFLLGTSLAPPSFTGAYTFTVTPAAGADCADQLTTHGGGYVGLPCTVTYTLSATRQ